MCCGGGIVRIYDFLKIHRQGRIRVHSFLTNVPHQPRNLELGVFWKRTYVKIAENSTKPPKIAESGLI